ncbi:MAG: hypothetical protein DDT28_00701 [Dehalococcoidia bacterium]|nr:hypothetical protein [Chloroflexota bacterium]
MRRHCGKLPGTCISCPQSRATCVHPICRAANAGNSAVRSGVVVKKAQAISSTLISLARIIFSRSSLVACRMDSLVFSSTVVAPRMPRQRIDMAPFRYKFSV